MMLAMKGAEKETEKTGADSFDRMIDVYQKAKLDYYLADAKKQLNKFSLVRFLRDTAENLLLQLGSAGFSHHPLVPELREVVGVSRAHAVQLSGRKRVFEDEGPRTNPDSASAHFAPGSPDASDPFGGPPAGSPRGGFPSRRPSSGRGSGSSRHHRGRGVDSYRPMRE